MKLPVITKARQAQFGALVLIGCAVSLAWETISLIKEATKKKEER